MPQMGNCRRYKPKGHPFAMDAVAVLPDHIHLLNGGLSFGLCWRKCSAIGPWINPPMGFGYRLYPSYVLSIYPGYAGWGLENPSYPIMYGA
jgi:hypothetical protein